VTAAKHPLAKPFLKWAGGKGQLLPELEARVEAARPFGRYHEPFVGGAALFFALSNADGLGRGACLSDSNPNLIEAYRGVRDRVDELIPLLKKHETRHSRDYYYQMRAAAPKTQAARAARVVYLNRTCYNGLYRENSRGEFNVPMGRYQNPRVCHEENLRAAARALQEAEVECRPFETVLERAVEGDLVYFDPPYHPVSRTSSFTAYDRGGFGEDQQRRLAEVFAALAGRGVKVILSNSMTELVRELYGGFRIEEVYARRAVNSMAGRRGPVPEALVTSF